MATFDLFDVGAEIGPLLRRCDRYALDLYESSVGPNAPTRQQCGVLLAIFQEDNPTQAQIAQRSGIDRSTVAGIVRRLVKKSLVKLGRTTLDNRAVTHMLTAKGFAVLDQSMQILIETQERLVAPVPASMRPIFLECLQRIASHDPSRDAARDDDWREEAPTRPIRRRRREDDQDGV